jgi:Ca2+/H+ antiporter, TMEM165/GDT1 family
LHNTLYVAFHPSYIQLNTGGSNMNLEKVVFGFFIVLAMTLNFGFFLGDIDNVSHHHVYELYAAIIVSLIATVLKFGDRTQLGAILLSTSLAADLQLISAAIIWAAMEGKMEGSSLMVYIVSLSGGALMANFVSVVLLISETITQRR